MKPRFISRLADLRARGRGKADEATEPPRDDGEEALAERREMIMGVQELGDTIV